ncbi:MAG: hypothetical protein M0003_07300 [Acidithiobacillus sp.]|nr:hypothetical protein [Acidithiobacillus sp.]
MAKLHRELSVTNRILRGISSGFVLTAVSTLVAVIQLRLILEYLHSDIAGIWLLFITIGSYIAFLDMGISPTIGREISFVLGFKHFDEQHKRAEVTSLIATCARLFDLLSAMAFMLALMVGGWFFWHVTPVGSQSNIEIAWCIFALGGSLNLLGGPTFAALYGLGNIATERLIRSVTLLVGLAIMVLFLNLGFGIVGLAVIWSVQGLAAMLIARRILHVRYPYLHGSKGVISMAVARKIALPSLKWAAMGFGAILILQTDNVVIAAVIGTPAIPSYVAAAKIVTVLMTLSLMIVSSSSPFLSKSYAAADMDTFKILLLRNVRYGMGLLVILSAFIAIFGDKIINLWLGLGHFAGFPVLWTLLTMTLLEVHHVTLATGTMATGKIAFAWAALIAGSLNIIISVILAQRLGLWGVALGTMIAQMLTNNWYAPYVTLTLFNIPFVRYFSTVILPIFVLVIVSIGINVVLRYVTAKYGDMVSLLISGCSAIPSTTLTALALLTTASERQTMLRMIRNMRKAL